MVTTDSSLFGHLALRFTNQTENLATEALNFILHKSDVARAQMIALASQTGIALPSDLQFRTQALGADSAIPDLVGEHRAGVAPLLIEAKFWAGLTEKQPVEYLRRLQALPDQQPGVLLVVAPAKRFHTLWPELLSRCTGRSLSLDWEEKRQGEFWVASVDGQHRMALVSWRALLSGLRAALELSGDRGTIADVEQLLGLCNRMDTEAFIPLIADDLAFIHARRILQYIEIVDAVVAIGLDKGWCSKQGLRQSSSAAWYGHWIKLAQSGACPEVDLRKWSRHRETPIWLTIAGKDWKDWSAEWHALLPLAHEIRPRMLVDETQKRPVIPLYLPTGVERDAVIDAVVKQVLDVHKRLVNLT